MEHTAREAASEDEDNAGMKLRPWLRQLEPRVLAEFDRPSLAWLKPWLDRHDVFSFTREPLARGVALGLFFGLVPGPVQLIGTTVACAWLRGNIIAGGLATLWTNPLTIVPIYMLAFQLGALVLPGEHPLPSWNGDAAGLFSGLVEWVRELGAPLLVGLPTLGVLVALNAYALVQIAFLTPVWRRARRMRILLGVRGPGTRL